MPRRLPLSCRSFRAQHAEFSDGLLAPEVLRALGAHRDACADCARHDVLIRRSMLALQVLPEIEPSADFRDRLYARLALEAAAPAPAVPTARGIRWGIAGAVIAASMALLFAASVRSRHADQGRTAPVLAQVPVLPSPAQPAQPVPSAPPRVSSQGRTPDMTSSAARRAPRFEALPGQDVLRATAPTLRGGSMRLQTVGYFGQ